ncbi:MAG: hypothetical protein GY749_29840, partial [Desulfobacteraceae bacterium]|nr:hypothetical protein [Desulfobacteraceae bacterium]
VISSSGVIVWEAAYMPFGKAWVITETVVNNFRFPGQYYDEETGLHYNWHRYYNPNTGRYLTPDPIGGINLYYYVRNNPANLIDPTGEIPVDTIWDAINIIYDIATGDWKSLAADSAAIVIPYVPAGLTKVNKVCKIGKALKYGISADEIRAINKSLGGVTELTGDASSIIAAAERYEGFWNKTAAMVREIAGRHMFNDANKRTAQAVVQELMKRNKISTGVSSGEMRKVINQVARGELKEVSDIAKALTLQRHLADNCLKS